MGRHEHPRFPNAGLASLEVDVGLPAEAFDGGHAMELLTSLDRPVDQLTVLAIEPEEPGESDGAVLEVFGIAADAGSVSVSLRLPAANFGAVHERTATVDVHAGDDAASVARRLAEGLGDLPDAWVARSMGTRLAIWGMRLGTNERVSLEARSSVRGLAVETLGPSSVSARAMVTLRDGVPLRVRRTTELSAMRSLFTSCLVPDAELAAVEVTQAVQDWQNSVSLVAGKRTRLRVFLREEDAHGSGIVGSLARSDRPLDLVVEARQCARHAPSSCGDGVFTPMVPMPGPIHVVSRHDEHSRKASAIEVELPSTLLSGPIEIRVRSRADRLRCREIDSEGSPIDCRVRVDFRDDAGAPWLQFTPVSIREELEDDWDATPIWQESVLALDDAIPLHMRASESGLMGRRPMPVVLSASERPVASDTSAANAYQSEVHALMRRWRARYCVPGSCPVGIVIGFQEPRTRMGTGELGVAVVDTVASGAAPLVVHEVLHAFGRPHSPYCMGQRAVSACAEPYPAEWTMRVPVTAAEQSYVHPGVRPALGAFGGSVERSHFGFRPSGNEIMSPTDSWDVMSYCYQTESFHVPKWMSVFHWERLQRTLVGTDGRVTGGDIPYFRRFPWAPRDVCGQIDESLLEDIAASPSEPGAFFNGRIEPDGTLAFDAAFEGEGVPWPLEMPTEHELVAVADDGAVLGRYAIDTIDPAAQGGHSSARFVVGFAPRVPGVARWEVRRRSDGATLGGVEPSAHAPEVRIDEPAAGVVWESGRATVRWTALDVDGDELRYLVEYSHDDGATWIGVADVDTPEVSLSVDALNGGTACRLRVWASDGVRNGMAEVGPFAVARRVPFVHLRAPIDGSEFRADEGVIVDGDAFDQEGRLVESLVWELDGRPIEPTTMFDASELTPGEHMLTLRATDATGLAAEDQSRFVVLAPATSRLSLRVEGPRRLVPGAEDVARVTVTHVSGEGPATLPPIVVGEHPLLQLRHEGPCTRPRHRRELHCTAPEALEVGGSWSFDVPFTALEHGLASVTAVLERPDAPPELAQLVVDVSGVTWDVVYEGEEGRAPATLHARNVHDVTEPSGFEVVVPLPRGTGEVVPASDDWRCDRGADAVACTWRGAEVPSGVALPEVRFEPPPRPEGSSSSEVVFDVELVEPAAGTQGSGTVVARNVGERRHSRDLWFVRRFERVTVARAAGDGWACRTEVNDVSCVLAGGLDVGASSAPLTITLDGLAPSNVVTEIVEHPAAKPPGAEVRYLVEVRNEGEGPVLDTVTARGTWPEGETVVAAIGEHWTCEFAGRDFSCRYFGGVVRGGDVLPHIALFVRIAAADGGADAGAPVDSDAGTTWDGGVPFDAGFGELDGGSSFDADTDSSAESSDAGPADSSEDTSDASVDAPIFEGVQLAIEGFDACNRIVDPATGVLTPRELVDGVVVVDPVPGMPYCYSIEQVPSNAYVGDGVPSDPAVALPSHVAVAYDAPRQGGPWRYYVRVRNVGTEASTAPLRVRVSLPRDLPFRAFEGRTETSSVSTGWSCVDEGALGLLCTSDRTLAPGAEALFHFGLRAEHDAWREQRLVVALDENADSFAADDRFEDRLSNVVQPFGAPPHERLALEAARAPSRVAVSLEAPATLDVDVPATLRATVRSESDEALPAESVHVRLLGAPSFVHVQSAQGEGWRCTPRWGEVTCVHLAEVAPRASLAPIEVGFLPGPQPGEMLLPARVYEVDRAEVAVDSRATVRSSERPDVGVLASSGCAPHADCWPTSSPLLSGGIDRSPRLQFAGTDGSLRGALDVAGVDVRGAALRTPRFSADGSELVFVARNLGSTVHRARHRADGWAVEWSDVSGFPFVRAADLTSELLTHVRGSSLFVIDRARGSSPRFWDSSNGSSTDPQRQWKQVALSPDGSRLVALRGEPGTLFLGEITRSGSGALQLSAPVAIPIAGARDASFSPDGTRLALSVGGRIAIVALDGSDVRLVTDGGGPDEADVRPAWSPDGAWLAFERGAPDELEGRAAVSQDVARHRAENRGVIEPYRDAAIFVVPSGAELGSTASEPWLVVRGRTPAWMPTHEVEPPVSLDVPPPREGEPTIVLEGARTFASAGPVELRGRASAIGPIDDGGRFLFAFDQGGRGTLGRTERELVRALARDAAPGWVAPCEDGTTLRCALTNVLADVARQPGALVAARSYVNEPSELWAFEEDLAITMGAQLRTAPLADSDGDGVPDLAELVGPRGSWPRGAFPAAQAISQRDRFGIVSDGFDAALADLAAAFDAWPSEEGEGAKVAYLVTPGRTRVDDSIEGAIAELRARDVRVHALVPPGPTVRPTVVVVAGRGLASHADRVDALMHGLDELSEDAATLLTVGDARIARGTHFEGEGTPAELLTAATTWLRSHRAAGSFTHLVVVTPGERDSVSYATLEPIFRDGLRVHAMLPPGFASRPVARCGNGFADRFGHYERLAEETGGTYDSLCEGALNVPTAIAADVRAGFVDECDHPASAAATVARLTGGRCVVLDREVPPLLPSTSAANEDAIASLDAELDGVVLDVQRRDGLFALSPTLSPGRHELVVRLTTTAGRVAEERATLVVNTPPLAITDSVQIPRAGVLSFDVLSNDTDPDGDALRLVSASGALFGNVSCTATGLCTYVDLNPSAPDAFTYVVEDAHGARAIGRVDVGKHVNAAPVARNASFEVAPGGSTAFDLASLASDADGDALTFELPSHASVGYLDCVGPRCVYAGAPEEGIATFFYRVRDPLGAVATGEVTLAVSDTAARLAGALESELGDGTLEVGAQRVSLQVDNVGASRAELVRAELRVLFGAAVVDLAGAGWTCAPSVTGRVCERGPLDAGASAMPLELALDVPEEADEVAIAFVVQGVERIATFAVRRPPATPVTPVTPLPLPPVEPEPEEPETPPAPTCLEDAPVCTTGRQTLLGQCTLAESVGIANEGACLFGESIPDGSTAGVLLPIVVAGGASSTQLALDLRLRHPDRGQLTVRVRAPNGAQLTLHDRSGAGVPDFAWRGTIRVPWTGVNGRWTVSVGDGVAGGEGTVEYVNLTAR
jgi:hypothetical protein